MTAVANFNTLSLNYNLQKNIFFTKKKFNQIFHENIQILEVLRNLGYKQHAASANLVICLNLQRSSNNIIFNTVLQRVDKHLTKKGLLRKKKSIFLNKKFIKFTKMKANLFQLKEKKYRNKINFLNIQSLILSSLIFSKFLLFFKVLFSDFKRIPVSPQISQIKNSAESTVFQFKINKKKKKIKNKITLFFFNLLKYKKQKKINKKTHPSQALFTTFKSLSSRGLLSCLIANPKTKFVLKKQNIFSFNFLNKHKTKVIPKLNLNSFFHKKLKEKGIQQMENFQYRLNLLPFFFYYSFFNDKQFISLILKKDFYLISRYLKNTSNFSTLLNLELKNIFSSFLNLDFYPITRYFSSNYFIEQNKLINVLKNNQEILYFQKNVSNKLRKEISKQPNKITYWKNIQSYMFAFSLLSQKFISVELILNKFLSKNNKIGHIIRFLKNSSLKTFDLIESKENLFLSRNYFFMNDHTKLNLKKQELNYNLSTIKLYFKGKLKKTGRKKKKMYTFHNPCLNKTENAKKYNQFERLQQSYNITTNRGAINIKIILDYSYLN